MDPEPELKDQRVTIMMTKSELALIDDWMFANRIRSRGEAIRQMCRKVLLKDLKTIREAQLHKLAFGDDDRED
jgi:metal-responsive CopG/Arc/MetJ family transcriptional regulator